MSQNSHPYNKIEIYMLTEILILLMRYLFRKAHLEKPSKLQRQADRYTYISSVKS